ncbi:MAG: alpha-amylase family glycosyl hydrolase [Opitutaceae bacterium]|nr:alpha-amylase family glycosyl hydrolase [Opitutaceae bacterium]
MEARSIRIVRAWLDSPRSGVIELSEDWREEGLPPLEPGEATFAFESLAPAPRWRHARDNAYFVDTDGRMVFVVEPQRYTWIEWGETKVYVAGDFNNWQEALGREEWQLQAEELEGQPVWLLRREAGPLLRDPPLRFKFVTEEGRWLEVPSEAHNAVHDTAGRVNHAIHAHRTGRNLFTFVANASLALSATHSVALRHAGTWHKTRLRLGAFFHDLKTGRPLGAIVQDKTTIFRLFAPRAKHVRLFVCENIDAQDKAYGFELDPLGEGLWEAQLEGNLHGWYYWYLVSGPRDVFGHYNPNQRVLDPYALAAVSREGPGIVLDRKWVGKGDRRFRTPPWQDLVIAEAHVRDLTAHAPVSCTSEERLGFTGLRQWVESPDFHLKKLGVTAVELQPIQEFDNRTRDEYHWGYMPVNYFAPASAYALEPARASQVKEFQQLVAAFHRQDMAVIIDVVYNHVGEPNHLLGIDKQYYFEMGDDGALANWSGCGNDLRARSAMTRRLIIDSCTHLIEAYGVDGFRFDLAELLGVEVLREVEAALKQVKSDVILIAEPWSFRGHIAAELRTTGWTAWNDGYRNFLRDYVRGTGPADKLEYYLKGSPWHFAYWPAQTVNYTESHDDRTWIDVITENTAFNGLHPTLNDRRRTHLMAAILFASIGIPMISAGQDFLRSKRGVNNSYQRGDLNALNYRRLYHYPSTHAYFADWIVFRLSPAGRLLRQWSRPSEGFFRAYSSPNSPALALVYNADGSQGRQRLMFAVNPLLEDVTVPIAEVADWGWHQVADQECFFTTDGHEPPLPVGPELVLPVLGCGLWLAEL